ncbi:FAD/NAD(P)-binding domain-containing protein [Hypoxylon trugodes]|uniref:FAD/NAD(P)-binding domain-containing protein n=1 Tax=Hypoxylon trugodes TaxID=326681 RepID=UPI00218F244A|nr:FAD/NAD(P)-binding domain-containing protein [Hypoxylon trugodes]KAI1393319.1 FAD/NAD(P)-binding domain-containing protein [Hypoxylon trugodes]
MFLRPTITNCLRNLNAFSAGLCLTPSLKYCCVLYCSATATTPRFHSTPINSPTARFAMASQFSTNVSIGRSTANPYKVLIAGGCYGGLAAVVNLLEKCDTIEDPIPLDITIVDERDGFYHVIGSPLALASSSYAEKAWVKFKDIPILQRPDVRFVHGTVSSVDPESKTAIILEQPERAERSESYDFFVAATGLRRVWPVVPQSLKRDDYLQEAGRHIKAVINSTAPVLIVGGGAVGIEMAAELKVTQPHVQVTLAHSRSKLLSAEPLPDNVKDCALELTKNTGVDVLLEHRLKSHVPITRKNEATGADEQVFQVEFENGHKMLASQVVLAISRSEPSTSYLPTATQTEEKYVRVRPTLQLLSEDGNEIANADTHFAIGDLIHWSGIKRCGSAMHQGHYAGLNIHQLMLQELQGKEPTFHKLNEIPPMIGLAVGKNALSYGGEGMKHGKQIMEWFFEEDLGFRIVWDHLRLGGTKA